MCASKCKNRKSKELCKRIFFVFVFPLLRERERNQRREIEKLKIDWDFGMRKRNLVRNGSTGLFSKGRRLGNARDFSISDERYLNTERAFRSDSPNSNMLLNDPLNRHI